MIELLNMDCIEYMAGCEDNAFDLAIVDPPYAVGASDGKFGGRSGDKRCLGGSYAHANNGKNWPSNTGIIKKHYANHNQVPDENYFCQLFRVSKNQIIWGANYYPEHLHHSGWIVWDKLVTGPLSDCELAFHSFNKLVEKFTCQWSGYKKGECKKYNSSKIHPNQKPVRLYEWCLEKYAQPGQRILDTHLGSGSSAIAAHYFGCDFVGTEIDPDYFKAAQERFDNETKQVAMF